MNPIMNFTYKLSRIFITILLVATGVFCGQTAKAQFSPDSSGFHFDNSILGARAASLANTQVSDAYSLEGIYTNPAAFLFSESNTTLSSNFFYNNYFNTIAENLNAVLIRNNNHLLAAGATIKHNAPSSVAPLQPNVPIRFNQYGLSIFYATKLTPTFSAGGGVSGVYGSTTDDRNWGITTNLGLFYAPSSSVSYGLAYSGLGGRIDNLGAGLHYIYTEELDENGQETESTTLILEKIPHRLELGATFRFPSISKRPDFKLSFANEKIFGEPGLIYKVGLELFPTEILAVRGGYFFSPIASGGRLGLGVFIRNMSLDYSFSQTTIGVEGYSHQLSISIGLFSSN